MDRCGWFLIQGRTRSYRASVALTSPSLYRWIFRCALSSPPHADHATSAEYLSVLAFTPSRLHKESSVLLSKANSARATFNVSTVFHGFGDGHPRNAQPALSCLLSNACRLWPTTISAALYHSHTCRRNASSPPSNHRAANITCRSSYHFAAAQMVRGQVVTSSAWMRRPITCFHPLRSQNSPVTVRPRCCTVATPGSRSMSSVSTRTCFWAAGVILLFTAFARLTLAPIHGGARC